MIFIILLHLWALNVCYVCSELYKRLNSYPGALGMGNDELGMHRNACVSPYLPLFNRSCDNPLLWKLWDSI